MPPKIEVEFIENFLIVWNPVKGSELFKKGFYGKPIGIPKPKIPEFEVPLILDLIEGLYLAEKKIITIYEISGKKRKVGLNKLLRRARKLYDNFDEKYAVYHDLRESAFIVTPGIKFGCDFAVYKRGPGLEHAPYMVTVKKNMSEISATDIVKAGRLATAVRKRFIIAVTDLKNEKNRYLIFKWFKA